MSDVAKEYALDDIALSYAPVPAAVAVLAKDGIELPVWVLLACHRDLETSETFVGLSTIAGLLQVHRNTIGLAVKSLIHKKLLVDKGRQKQGHGGKWDPRVLVVAIDGKPLKLSMKAADRAQKTGHGEGENRAHDRAHDRASKTGHDLDLSRRNEKDQKTPEKNLEIGHPNTDVIDPQDKTSSAPQSADPNSPEAAESAWADLVASDPFGPLLEKMASNAASKNKSGKQSATARWNQIGQPYEKLLEGDHPPEAVRYALSETVRREAVSIAYATKVLQNNPKGKPAARRAKKNPAMYMDVSLNHDQKIKYWGTFEDDAGNLAVSLVPEEYMGVGYGRAVKEYLLGRVTLVRVHRFKTEDAQFSDALVSSAVVWFRNEPPPVLHTVEFTLGGTLSKPEVSAAVPSSALDRSAKWTKFPLAAIVPQVPVVEGEAKLKDLFEIRRGLATGANKFFILSPERVRDLRLPERFLRPILPSPRYLDTDEVGTDEAGTPLLGKRRLLLSCDLPEEEVRADHPALWSYLRKGIEAGVHEGYLCSHRSPWYSQESRPPAPLLCTYMGRRDAAGGGRPFRFILNRSQATAPNVYLMLYPKPAVRAALVARPELIEEIWAALNALDPAELSAEGRVYGGGLHKLEPKELSNAPAAAILDAIPGLVAETPREGAPALFNGRV